MTFIDGAITTLLSFALCACTYIAIYATVVDTRDWNSRQRRLPVKDAGDLGKSNRR